MSLFSAFFRLCLLLAIGFLAYDYYCGDDGRLGDSDRLQHAWRDTDLSPDAARRFVHHASAAWIELKRTQSPRQVMEMFKHHAMAMDGNVHVLTQQTFDRVVNGLRPALVEFYAPWCGHCKDIAPIYSRLADAYKGTGVIIAKVNAAEEPALARSHGVRAFPTILWFPKGFKSIEHGHVDEYDGPPDLESLMRFIERSTGIAAAGHRAAPSTDKDHVVELTTETFLQAVEQPGTHTLVEFYKTDCPRCQESAPIYEKVAAAFAREPSCEVAKINAYTERAIAEAYGVTDFPTLQFFAAGKQAPILYDGPFSEAALIKFLNKQCGTHRLPNGGLGKAAGRIAGLDQLARKFAETADDDTRDNIQKQADAIAERLGNRHAKFYVTVMSNMRSTGDRFVSTESERLRKALESNDDNALSAETVDDCTVRRNILSVFDKRL